MDVNKFVMLWCLMLVIMVIECFFFLGIFLGGVLMMGGKEFEVDGELVLLFVILFLSFEEM